MRVYLVRHGQSTAHDSGKRQSPDSPLSEKGIGQAKALAGKIKEWDVSCDKVFSSELARARETAEIIAGELNLPVEVFEGIHEKEQHPGLYGIDTNSKLHKENVKAYEAHLRDLDYKFLGKGESVREVSVRAIKFRDHLLGSHLGQDVLVVSHGIFIRSFIVSCILGDNYDDSSFAQVYAALDIDNTGVSLLEFGEKNKNWKVIYLNN
jgi:broad specificity phosphatase PhoE